MSVVETKPILEALIFVSNDPIGVKDLQHILDEYPPEEVEQALQELVKEFETNGRGLIIAQAGGGYQMLTAPHCDSWIRKLLRIRSQERLTRAAIETLAIIAYKQPITLPEVLALRRVNSTGVIKTLLDKNLIRIVGRKKVVGNPILYGTTRDFLMRFGLNTLKELPSLEEFETLATSPETGIILEPNEPGSGEQLLLTTEPTGEVVEVAAEEGSGAYVESEEPDTPDDEPVEVG